VFSAAGRAEFEGAGGERRRTRGRGARRRRVERETACTALGQVKFPPTAPRVRLAAAPTLRVAPPVKVVVPNVIPAVPLETLAPAVTSGFGPDRERTERVRHTGAGGRTVRGDGPGAADDDIGPVESGAELLKSERMPPSRFRAVCVTPRAFATDNCSVPLLMMVVPPLRAEAVPSVSLAGAGLGETVIAHQCAECEESAGARIEGRTDLRKRRRAKSNTSGAARDVAASGGGNDVLTHPNVERARVYVTPAPALVRRMISSPSR